MASLPVQRVKICMLGSSRGGKTSLVRSITSAVPYLVAEEDRTIGIDLFSSRFKGGENLGENEAIFWDFAGQDVYQVANALFFSSRTLYLLCVDLNEYYDGLMSVETPSSYKRDADTQRLVERQVFRWARLIFGRQPDARIVVVGTKADLLEVDPARLRRVEADLKSRITEWCQKFVKEFDATNPLRESVRRLLNQPMLVVSVKTEASVARAKASIEDIVATVETIGLSMTEPYQRVFDMLQHKRTVAAGIESVLERMKELVPTVNKLVPELAAKCELACGMVQKILRDFHDQGDVLWYEQENAGSFKKYVMLSPRIVLNIVRELINHNYQLEEGPEYEALRSRGEVKHSLLVTFPTWKLVNDAHDDVVYMFKMLMAFYQLAYPVGKAAMAATSDLIVPTYWKSRRNPSESCERGSLTKSVSMLRREQLPRSFAAYWQYTLPAELSETIFDQFVVQSHSHSFTRTVTAECIEAESRGKFATRIFFEEGQQMTDSIRIEVVGTSDANCWNAMRFYVMSMEIVLDGYPGLLKVSRDILYRDSDGLERAYAVPTAMQEYQDAVALGIPENQSRLIKPWLPPSFHWFSQKAWHDPILQAELDEQERQQQVKQNRAVIQKLTASSDKRRTLPALFTVRTSREQPEKLAIQLLSDLSGVCYHDPIMITPAEGLRAKIASFIKPGISVFATVPKSCLDEVILAEVLEMGRAGLVNPVEHAQPVHNMAEGFQFARQGLPGVATMEVITPSSLLRDLLGVQSPSEDVEVLTRCGLLCGATTAGEYIWASREEVEQVDGLKSRMLEDIRKEVEASRHGGLSPVASQATLVRQSYTLAIKRAYGIPEEEWPKSICCWELTVSGQKAIDYGSTAKYPALKSRSKSVLDSTWPGNVFPLTNIGRLATLRESRLKIEVKKKRHWLGAMRTVATGSIQLGPLLVEDKKEIIDFKVELSCGGWVDCALTIKEEPATSHGA